MPLKARTSVRGAGGWFQMISFDGPAIDCAMHVADRTEVRMHDGGGTEHCARRGRPLSECCQFQCDQLCSIRIVECAQQFLHLIVFRSTLDGQHALAGRSGAAGQRQHGPAHLAQQSGQMRVRSGIVPETAQAGEREHHTVERLGRRSAWLQAGKTCVHGPAQFHKLQDRVFAGGGQGCGQKVCKVLLSTCGRRADAQWLAGGETRPHIAAPDDHVARIFPCRHGSAADAGVPGGGQILQRVHTEIHFAIEQRAVEFGGEEIRIIDLPSGVD